MKWFKKYIRSSFDKEAILKEIKQHHEIINQANDALERLSLDGEDHWFEEEDGGVELECTVETLKLRRDKKNGALVGVARAHCSP